MDNLNFNVSVDFDDFISRLDPLILNYLNQPLTPPSQSLTLYYKFNPITQDLIKIRYQTPKLTSFQLLQVISDFYTSILSNSDFYRLINLLKLSPQANLLVKYLLNLFNNLQPVTIADFMKSQLTLVGFEPYLDGFKVILKD